MKPEWLEDELLAFASVEARVASIGLILLADDYGNGRGNVAWLRGQLFPGDDSTDRTRSALEELARMRYVVFYEVEGQRYFSIRNWEKHQKVDKPGKPRVPAPPAKPSKKQPDRVAKKTETSGIPIEETENPPESLAKVPESLAPDLDLDQDHDLDREQEQDHRAPRAPAAAAPVDPKNLEQALQVPIGDRARFAEANPHRAPWICPELWPELKTFADFACEAMGLAPVPLAAYQRDPGVRALVTLFATFTPSQLAQALTAIPGDPWFRSRRGLSSFSVEVVRRLLDARPDAPPGPVKGSKRQPDYPGQQTFKATEQVTPITEATP